MSDEKKQRQQAFNDTIKRIFVNGQIKSINWGGEKRSVKNVGADGIRLAEEDEVEVQGWHDWDTDAKLAFAMELASAMNQAADIMQTERNALAERTLVAEKQVENLDERMLIYRGTLSETITAQNAEKQAHATELKKLQVQIREQGVTINELHEQVRALTVVSEA